MCLRVSPKDHEINMLGEVTHLQTILEDLMNLTAEPNKLPPASEQVQPWPLTRIIPRWSIRADV